jgi:hypothetical protein
MRANPGFAVLGIHAIGGLNGVFDSALEFGAARTDSNQVEVQLWLRFLLLLLFGSVTARH